MSEQEKVFESFRKTFSKTFDSVEACNRQNLNETMIEEMRVKLKKKKFVPKVIINSQVG